MHCPRCGFQQNSNEIRFCTKCGLEISDVKSLLAPETVRTKAQRKSANNTAARQGLMLILAGFVSILILAILRDFYTIPQSLFAVAVLIFIIGGAIRMALPSLAGGKNSTKNKDDWRESALETNKLSGGQSFDKILPEAEDRPPIDFGERDFDTNELVPRSSVTEGTTRELENSNFENTRR